MHFQVNRSVPHLLLRIFFEGGLAQLKDVASMPSAANIKQIRAAEGISPWVVALNVAAENFGALRDGPVTDSCPMRPNSGRPDPA